MDNLSPGGLAIIRVSVSMLLLDGCSVSLVYGQDDTPP